MVFTLKDWMRIDLSDIKIYYINLPEHTERNTSFMERMLSAGFSKQKIERVEGIRMQGIAQDPVYVGCFHSQLKTLKLALSGEYPFIVLEDDAQINYLPDFIEVPDNTDALYVGISAWGFCPAPNGNLAELNRLITDRVDSNVVKVFNMLSSHAILYNKREYVEKLISDLESNLAGEQQKSKNSDVPLNYHGGSFLPCDIIMANNQYHNHVYALRNPIFYQGDKHQYCTLFKI